MPVPFRSIFATREACNVAVAQKNRFQNGALSGNMGTQVLLNFEPHPCEFWVLKPWLFPAARLLEFLGFQLVWGLGLPASSAFRDQKVDRSEPRIFSWKGVGAGTGGGSPSKNPQQKGTSTKWVLRTNRRFLVFGSSILGSIFRPNVCLLVSRTGAHAFFLWHEFWRTGEPDLCVDLAASIRRCFPFVGF